MNKLVAVLVGAVLATAGLVVASPAAFADSAPVISGSGKVGTDLTVTDPGSFGAPVSSYVYSWRWDGEDGPDDADAVHTVTPADVGHPVDVLVIALDASGAEIGRDVSNSIDAVPGSQTAPAVTISGTRTVPHTLTASLSGGTAGAEVTDVVWVRDGVEIPDGSGLVYTLTNADAGHRIAVRTTSTHPDYADLVATSTADAIRARNTRKPTISGTAKVGKKLSLRSRGTWYQSRGTYAYRWVRNGSSISGATRSTYKLTSKDKGKRIALRVTWRRSGFSSVSATSSTTSKVKSA